MFEFHFPQDQFRRHDPHCLVQKKSKLMGTPWPHTHESWYHEIPYENATSWKEVRKRLKTRRESTSKGTKEKEEKIK